MNEELLKKTIAENIAHYRKANNDTQAGLAEKLSYSDKSVSKWERGEGLPDICVLVQIAELYNIKVENLISNLRPARADSRRGKCLITLMSVGLVWLVAAVVFCALKLFDSELKRSWLAFIFALPVSFIVLTIFANIWWGKWLRFASVSGLIWAVTLCIVLSVTHQSIYLLFIVATVLQVLACLWFALPRNHKDRSTESRVDSPEPEEPVE